MQSPIARRGAGIVRLLRLVLRPLMQEEASDTDTDKFVILTHYIYIIYASSGSCFRRENKILVYISDFDEGTWLLVYTQNGSLES